MFCNNKYLQNQIDRIHKLALRIVSNEPTLNLDELVELDMSIKAPRKSKLREQNFLSEKNELPFWKNKPCKLP